MKVFAIIFLFCFSSYVKIAVAAGTILFKLETYKNLQHGTIEGKCCDDDFKVPPACRVECDNFFIICFSSSHVSRSCDYGNVWIHDLSVKDEGAVFPSRLEYQNYKDGYYENPHRLAFSKWNKPFTIQIDAFDADSAMNIDNHHRNDKIENFTINLVTNPGQNFTIAKNQIFNLKGVYAEMNVSAKVWCDKYYFAPSCTEYCKDRNDAFGHYRCNYDTATIECLEGWYGKNCICSPRNDDFGHYKCDNITGEKICLNGWSDPEKNCTTAALRASIGTSLLQSLPLPTSKVESTEVQLKFISINSTVNTASTHFNISVTYPLSETVGVATALPNFTHPMPKLPIESTKEQSMLNDPNFIVYILGISLFAVLLGSAIVGMWRIIPRYKRRRITPVENWQTTRRKRTISTKTGLPPTSSTRISFKKPTRDLDFINHSEKPQAVQLVKVRSLGDDDGINARRDACDNFHAKGNGQRKVTFSYYNQSYV